MKIPTDLLGEYIVRVIDLPQGIKSFVTFDDDDFANIYINAHIRYAQHNDAVKHEIAHILNDDIHNSDSIQSAEERAGA